MTRLCRRNPSALAVTALSNRNEPAFAKLDDDRIDATVIERPMPTNRTASW